MKKLNRLILLVLPALFLVSCYNLEKRNQVKQAGIWEISKITSTKYAAGQITQTLNYEGELGEITFLNLNTNDFNDCYLRMDTSVHTAFQTSFNAISSHEDEGSAYYQSQWGTNLASLKYLTFFQIGVDPVNAASWSVAVDEQSRLTGKQKWTYTHFDTFGNVVSIEQFELKKK